MLKQSGDEGPVDTTKAAHTRYCRNMSEESIIICCRAVEWWMVVGQVLEFERRSKATIKILNSKVGTLRLIVFGIRYGHSSLRIPPRDPRMLMVIVLRLSEQEEWCMNAGIIHGMPPIDQSVGKGMYRRFCICKSSRVVFRKRLTMVSVVIRIVSAGGRRMMMQ
jgi:hypothetical protein